MVTRDNQGNIIGEINTSRTSDGNLSENPGEIGSPRIFTEKNQCFTRALAVDSLIGS